MKSGLKKKLFSTLAVSALVAMSGNLARADDTAAEIRLLKAQLRALEKKVAAQEAAQRRTQVAVARVAASAPAGGLPIFTKGAPPALCPDTTIGFKGLCITPGGFFAGEAAIRDKAQQTGLGSSFQNIPFNNNRLAHVGESRIFANQSRLSLLVQGKVNPTLSFSGYGEFDFLADAQTGNINESVGFSPRVRLLYATVDKSDWGFHFLAGQQWSLVTMNGVGIEPRKENIPLTIDPQYLVGFNWARQAQLRATQQFGQFSVALAAEDASTTNVSGTTLTQIGQTNATKIQNFAATIGQCAGTGGTPTTVNPTTGAYNTINGCNTLSLNHIPDFTGKVAWDPTFFGRDVHVEGWGVLRDFYDRTGVVPTTVAASPEAGTLTTNNSNHDIFGGGGGGSILVNIVPKTFDLQFSGSYGNGMGRYGSGQLADVTFNQNGALKPIPEAVLLAGAILHIGSFDIYGYAGQEQVMSTIYGNTGAKGGPTGTTVTNISGYGNGPFNNNAGCSLEGSTLCTTQTKKLREFTGGIWDNFYRGQYGLFKAGVQYEYIERSGFSDGINKAPKVDTNVVYTSIRYYPF